MIYFEKSSLKKSVLLLNKANVITENNFYADVFRIPEVLNRLQQYKEILKKSHINIPIWVYSLTQNIKGLLGSPQPLVLNFLISLGLFDRYIIKHGWPQYILGSEQLISILSCEMSFEELALGFTRGDFRETKPFQLYKVKSYYNHRTGSCFLTSFKPKYRHKTLTEILDFFIQKKMGNVQDLIFQFLSPHEDEFLKFFQFYGFYPKDFLEWDSNLKWLWPIWKKTQMQILKQNKTRK